MKNKKVFKIRVKVTKTYIAEIFAVASSEGDALNYLEEDQEWKQDEFLDEQAEAEEVSYEPLLATRLASRHDEVFNLNTFDTIPWNNDFDNSTIEKYVTGDGIPVFTETVDEDGYISTTSYLLSGLEKIKNKCFDGIEYCDKKDAIEAFKCVKQDLEKLIKGNF